MKNLYLTFCLVIAALLASVGSGFASDLPPCPSSGFGFDNCFGSYNTNPDVVGYLGEWKDDRPHGKALEFGWEVTNTSANSRMANGTGKAPITIN